jgi:hypothetical protein
MLEVLEFIFSSPARFGGTALLLMIISRWNLVKVVQKSDASIIEKLAEIGNKAKSQKEQQLNS